MRRALPLALCLSLVACERAVPAIGDVAADRTPWASLDAFAHYRGLLQGATTVGELITQPLTFTGRPTPRALLQAQRASNPAARPDAVALSVLSYNVAMLDVSLFGLVPYTATPHLAARRAVLPQAVFAQGYDIVGLQELWSSADVTLMRAAAEAAGYWLVTSSRSGFTDGTALAVRRSVAPLPTEVWFEHYQENSANEFFPANGFSRGFLAARLNHATLGPIVVYVTHAAAFPDAYRLRMRHARELGLDVQQRTRPNEVVLLLGDFNAAPYYRADTWPLPGGTTAPGWYANTLSYPVLLHYTGAVDLALRGRAEADADLDITAGDAVVNNPAGALTSPFGTPSYCATVPRDAFTATDCNSLYFTQYAGTEFPARLDYVFGRDPGQRLHVEESRVVFTDPVAYGGMMGPLSDHYGQLVRLRVARP
jgi:endonuclease/exonuclease/phosphatase family metal-dependent hydrolase